MKYSFNHAGPYVEISELDRFLHELRAVCKGFRTGFNLLESGLILVPFEKCDWDIFTDCLRDYEQGVPFLDEAKLRWKIALEKLEQEEVALRAQQQQKVELQAAERLIRQEEGMRAHGIMLSDGLYRLVKEE